MRLTLLALVLVAGAYFVNVEVQSWLGRRALAQTGVHFLDFDQATQAAQTSGKPLLVYVSAIWCPNCRHFDQNVWSDPEFNKIAQDKLTICRLEFDDERTQAKIKAWGTRGFPQLLILQGDQVKPVQVLHDPKAMLDVLGLR